MSLMIHPETKVGAAVAMMARYFQRVESMVVLPPWAVSHASVTANAIDVNCSAVSGRITDVGDEILVATNAVFVQSRGVYRPNADGIGESLESEFYRMIPAIVGFGDELRNERVR